MVNWVFFRYLEARLVETLLRSPLFHRSVEQVHRRVHQLRYGRPPEHYGGTNLEEPAQQGGLKHLAKLFWEELKSGHKPEVPPKR